MKSLMNSIRIPLVRMEKPKIQIIFFCAISKMPYRKSYRRKYRKSKNPQTGKSYMGAKKVQAMINRSLAKNIETKTGIRPCTDGVEIGHNNFQYVSNSLLQTTQGDGDEENTVGQRVGDKIHLKGISIKGMLELNERYSDVTFRIMIIKSAKGDIPTSSTLWQGASGNKMLDSMDTERYTVLFSKYLKIKAPNFGTNSGNDYSTSGVVYKLGGLEGETDYSVISRATRLFKIWIPGTKFGNRGFITYENNSTQPKFFDYHCMIYAYSNYTTSDAGTSWNVGRINDAFTKIYYKDA